MLHPDQKILSHNNSMKKTKTVLFYNKTKSGIDIIDQMARNYFVKAASKRWPIHVFYNVIDLALINSWILFQDICKSGISGRKFIQRVVEEITWTAPGESTGKNAVTQRTLIETGKPFEKKAKTMRNNKVL